MRFCIDPGHGGNDTGAIGYDKITKESSLNLSFALLFGNILSHKGHEIIYTRTSEKTVSLKERCIIQVKNKCDYFISIHHNAAADSRANGSESLVYNLRSIPPILKNLGIILPLATKFKNRGIIERRNIYVLKNTICHSILLEIGFISNQDDLLKCKDPSFQEYIAKRLCETIN